MEEIGENKKRYPFRGGKLAFLLYAYIHTYIHELLYRDAWLVHLIKSMMQSVN